MKLLIIAVILACATPCLSLAPPVVTTSNALSFRHILDAPHVTVGTRSRPHTHTLFGGFGAFGLGAEGLSPGHVPFGWPLGSNYGFTPWGYRSRGMR